MISCLSRCLLTKVCYTFLIMATKFRQLLEQCDRHILYFLNACSLPLARFALFVVFFWFGVLKIFDMSPASELVNALLQRTLPFVSYEEFMIFLGLYEGMIGVAFLIPRLERVAMALLIPHMITTFLPLLFLQGSVWHGFLIPTLEGQYIIKNLVLIALALSIASHLTPLSLSHRNKKC